MDRIMKMASLASSVALLQGEEIPSSCSAAELAPTIEPLRTRRDNPMRQHTNKVSKYMPHQSAREKNRRMKKMGLEPIHTVEARPTGKTLTLNVPDMGEIKIGR
jgi:hypothetical protein